MKQEDIYQPCEDVISRKMVDDVVLVNLNTEQIYTLNETGARFWELLESGKSIDQILVELLKKYDITEAELLSEIHAIVDQLLERGLIQHVK